jgi:hypothetical protein
MYLSIMWLYVYVSRAGGSALRLEAAVSNIKQGLLPCTRSGSSPLRTQSVAGDHDSSDEAEAMVPVNLWLGMYA